jgi:excinuclease ABC subunit B
LREGLDLPEVSLVAILDADKEGFLRSTRSLIQTIGRAARNVRGEVIMYADRETDSMRRAIQETNRRRALQKAYNETHGITPMTVTKAILDLSPTSGSRDYYAIPKNAGSGAEKGNTTASGVDLAERIEALRQEMFLAAESLEFEKAARLRDQIRILKGELEDSGAEPSPSAEAKRGAKGGSGRGGAGGRAKKSGARSGASNGRGRFR